MVIKTFLQPIVENSYTITNLSGGRSLNVAGITFSPNTSRTIKASDLTSEQIAALNTAALQGNVSITFVPSNYFGATPIGDNNYIPAATTSQLGLVMQAPVQAALTANPTQSDFNTLLTDLTSAGIMSPV